MSLAGRTAIVTGVSRRTGIGFAISKRLRELGATVVAHGWRRYDVEESWGGDDLDAVRAELGSQLLESDLADPDAPAALFDAVGSHVDILVVNHARSGSGQVHELTANELDAFLAVNVRASLLLVKEFAARHDGRSGGRVVLMTSGQHLGGMPGEVAYAVSKGALQQATATLAAGLAERGITVNCVNPGPTATGWDIGEPGDHTPSGRWGEPDDAARLVAWLCTDDARWITGQTINSEGGFRR